MMPPVTGHFSLLDHRSNRHKDSERPVDCPWTWYYYHLFRSLKGMIPGMTAKTEQIYFSKITSLSMFNTSSSFK